MSTPKKTEDIVLNELRADVRQRQEAEFAVSLAIARGIWKQHPEWVESAEMPERFQAAYRAENDGEECTDELGLDVLDPSWEASIEEAAQQMLIGRKNLEKTRQSQTAGVK